MPQRKQVKIASKETPFHLLLADELCLSYPEFKTGYDLESIEIIIYSKKPPPQIRNINKAIENLQRYIATNSKKIEQPGYEITKKDLADILKISRPTLDKWVKDGLVKKVHSKTLQKETYLPKEILQQLINQKKNI